MKFTIRTLALTLCLLAPFSAVAENSETALREQIKQMVSELGSSDREKIKAFIRNYAAPADLETLLQGETLDQLTDNFLGRNQDDLKQHLEAALAMTPIISENGTVYTFDEAFDASDRMHRDLVMVYSSEVKRFYVNN